MVALLEVLSDLLLLGAVDLAVEEIPDGLDDLVASDAAVGVIHVVRHASSASPWDAFTRSATSPMSRAHSIMTSCKRRRARKRRERIVPTGTPSALAASAYA